MTPRHENYVEQRMKSYGSEIEETSPVKEFCILGMRKNWIRSKEEKSRKHRQLIEKNRRQKCLEQTIEVCFFLSKKVRFLNCFFLLDSGFNDI
jgi:hypothetical protein